MMTQKNNHAAIVILLVTMIFALLTGCSAPKKTDDTVITEVADLTEKQVGILTGSIFTDMLEQSVQGANVVYFNNISDQVTAMRAGKLDAFVLDDAAAQEMIKEIPELALLDESLGSTDFGFILSQDNAALQEKINAVVSELNQSGELKRMKDKWSSADEAERILPEIPLSGENGVLQIATNADTPPHVFVKDGKIVGYEIELIMTVAQSLGMGVEINQMDFAAVLASVTSGKTDVGAGQICVSEERKKSMLFSMPTDINQIRVIIHNTQKKQGTGLSETAYADNTSWYVRLANSFERTFITENRYLLIVHGLEVTVLISVLSAIFGTLLGFAICLMRSAQTRWLNLPAKVFIIVIQGTPIVVMLMILYYIIDLLIHKKITPFLNLWYNNKTCPITSF